jgi:hypothetical protein
VYFPNETSISSLVGEAAREFNLAIVGSQTAKQACANAQASWEKILKRAGHLA